MCLSRQHRKDPGLSSVEASVGQRRQGFQLSSRKLQREEMRPRDQARRSLLRSTSTALKLLTLLGRLLWAVQLPLCRILTDGGTLLWQKYLERKALK